jgi:uncharacterized repeat protein (TIGR03803 family)
VNGTLYGTTVEGGGGGCFGSGCGTLFSLDPSTGAETVLYSFCGHKNCTDGAQPYGGLIEVNGALYGTTEYGGKDNDGTVFSLDPTTGTETVLHSFSGNSTDGSSPLAGVVDMNGMLYGTTSAGGTYGQGTVFSLDTGTSSEKMLYAFGSHGDDGALPEASLIDVHGTLYGTTQKGGSDGYGTEVSFNPRTGAESVLYSFCSSTNCEDGIYPEAALLKLQGRVYGTTGAGGAHQQGIVFWVKLP